MKIRSYKIVIIPFEYVPHLTLFRHKGDWWERVSGTTDFAEKYEENPEITTHSITKDTLVAIGKSQLGQKSLAHAFIEDEFDVWPRK